MKLFTFLLTKWVLLKVFFSNVFARLSWNKLNLKKHLPKLLKKQLLVVTLYLKGRNEKVFANVDMKELNKYLVIANDPKALEYLVSLSDVKYDFDFHNLLSQYNCNMAIRIDGKIVMRLSDEIVERTPEWLQYDKSEMVKDISALLLRAPMSQFYSCPVPMAK